VFSRCWRRSIGGVEIPQRQSFATSRSPVATPGFAGESPSLRRSVTAWPAVPRSESQQQHRSLAGLISQHRQPGQLSCRSLEESQPDPAKPIPTTGWDIIATISERVRAIRIGRKFIVVVTDKRTKSVDTSSVWPPDTIRAGRETINHYSADASELLKQK
jgi:hypothetical protein